MNLAPRRISFGDNVRVRTTPTTTARGVAGLHGEVRGQTIPSVVTVEIIGELVEDLAFNVTLPKLGQAFWFAAEVLELADLAPGSELRFAAVPVRLIRTEDGQWVDSTKVLKAEPAPLKKPWWKFW